jgi:putative spermidine/putrescine transport system permease protein
MKRPRPRSAVPWLLIGPTLAAFGALFVVPMLVLFSSSFDKWDPVSDTVVERFTTANYQRLLFDPYYYGVFLTTLRLSGLATLVCLILAYPVAIYLTKTSQRERQILLLLLLSPLFVTITIRVFGWLIILGPGGLLNSLGKFAGLVKGSFSMLYTQTALIIGLAHVEYPIMVLALFSSLQNVDPNLAQAAQNLGASRIQTFWRVTFPLTLPGMFAGTLIVFALSISQFVTPSLLGGPWVKMVAFLIWEQVIVNINWQFAAALGVLLLLVTLLIMRVYQLVVERGSVWVQRGGVSG